MRARTLLLLLALTATATTPACNSSRRRGGSTAAGVGSGTAAGGSGTGSGTPLPAVSPPASGPPSDDPNDWVVDTTVDYRPVLSAPQWVVPSPALPAQVQVQASNNNVSIAFHQGRLFLAWRTAPNHFASSSTAMYVISSTDFGATWELEREIRLGDDLREPSLCSVGGQLVFTFFEAGTNPLKWEPRNVWQTIRLGPGNWTPLASGGDPNEVPWEVKTRGGKAWRTSYLGNHFSNGKGKPVVYFKTSVDGVHWEPVDPANPIVYGGGGLSEVGFEFDERGGLWAVGRDEEGDATGFGSLLGSADAADLADWTWPSVSDPERYDSPRMFRHGDDLYLIARRDVGGPYDGHLRGLSFGIQKALYLASYSLRPKRTALYKIDRVHRRVVHLLDLPSAGDTAFPSVWRIGAHEFLIANYTSPLSDPDRAWIDGQLSPDGTQIYLLRLRFEPR